MSNIEESANTKSASFTNGSIRNSAPFFDTESIDYSNSQEEIIDCDELVDECASSPREESVLYSLDFDHDIILTDHETRPENFIGKRFTSIRKEALKKSGRASSYLKQVPRNVKNDVEQTTQKLKDAVANENNRVGSPRDEHSKLHSSRDELGKRKENKKRRESITLQKLEDLEEKQDIMISQLSCVIGETVVRECSALQKQNDEKTIMLQTENKFLMNAVSELTRQNQTAIELLQSTTKRVTFFFNPNFNLPYLF